MKLSEAILLGSVGTEQVRFEFNTINDRGRCAIGAACYAEGIPVRKGIVGVIYATQFVKELVSHWPVLARPMQCPVPSEIFAYCSPTNGTLVSWLGDIIMHLNDQHGWTRPQIAEWVKTIEASLLATQESTNEHSTTSASSTYPGER